MHSQTDTDTQHVYRTVRAYLAFLAVRKEMSATFLSARVNLCGSWGSASVAHGTSRVTTESVLVAQVHSTGCAVSRFPFVIFGSRESSVCVCAC